MANDEQLSRVPRYRSSGVGWPFVLLVLLAAFAIWRFSETRQTPLLDPDAQPRTVTPRGDLAADEIATIELFERVSPSVVHIVSIDKVVNSMTLDPFEIPRGIGSGVVWNKDGYIVTNYHVIKDAEGARITLSDGTMLKSKLVGTAPDQDLAVLKVETLPENLLPMEIGQSDDLAVGQKVFAIGNPFGFDHTLTTGTIGGLGRSVRVSNQRIISNLIQTDAAINPGNSGGPLLDSSGRMVGVTTAIYSPSGASAGLGFAVPVDMVNYIVPQLIKFGKVERPGLGIRPIPKQMTRGLRGRGLLIFPDKDDSVETQTGIRPTYLDPQTGATIIGDLIVAVDGLPVRGQQDLRAILSQKKVGDVVTVTVVRDKEEVNLEIPLKSIEQ